LGYSARMPSYRFETYGELQPWLSREWLLTNGTGSFASTTLVGCNTRRYHGLLVAATTPPVGRIVALSRLAESVAIDDHVSPIELSINHFNQHLIPRGDRYLRRFELNGTARYEFDADGVRVTKEVLLVWGKPIVGIRYTLDPGQHRRAELRINPFVALRDFHATMRKGQVHFELNARASGVDVGRDGVRLNLHADAGTFTERPDWWYDHTYPIEIDRGLDGHEDLFTPGAFTVTATSPTTFTLWAGVCHSSLVAGEGGACQNLNALDFDAEKKIVLGKDWANDAPTQMQKRLYRAASQFVAKRNRPDGSRGATILAGFPWFSDWGRDTMISLPGLLLSTRRFKEAGQVLSVFAGHVSEGMIPNYFNDYTNEPSYNTVDASLWFIHAAFEYLRVTKDQELFSSLLMPACEEIIDGYRAGTRFGIKMDDADGLIWAGDKTTQLTWMDAKMGDTVFTPRHGKPVEINALWYNALCLVGDGALAAKVKENFVKAFWISPYRGLADVVTGELDRDVSVRPNQIFAVSLPHSPLNLDQQKSVVEVVRRELLTPLGLRTLARGEPLYQPKLAGGVFERDRAYHNGTIWPWLIGHFLDAYLRVNNRSPDSQQQARAWLKPLLDHMENDACIGSISECADGDPPHLPRACNAQAWSVAEVLRLVQALEM
jgi:predicted glycogen debranching enzyme